MQKGWEQIAAALAILTVGAAYVPIDSKLPAARRESLLKRCEIAVSLVQESEKRTLELPQEVQRIVVKPSEKSMVDGAPEAAVSPDALAYVIFTSGSTGEPKGVMISHQSAFNTIADINDRVRVGPEDRVFGVSSFSFDLSVYDIFGPLSAGGAIVLPEPNVSPTPRHWLRQMLESGVTIWNSVPVLMQALVDYNETFGERFGARLRCVLLSGDWIPVELPRRIVELGENVRVISLGGATEGSIWSILFPVDPTQTYRPSIPYGRAMRNQSMHVLDKRLDARPDWAVGDIYIGGRGVAQGYFRDEVRTAQSYIEHLATGERLYRTGDLGRWLPDGNIEFLGREDFQVKVNGYRVELNEIEVQLETHPALRAVAVLVAGQGASARSLVAFVCPKPSMSVEPDEVKEFLAARLPTYMVPSRIIVLEALPLTSNGKVDRKVLGQLKDEHKTHPRETDRAPKPTEVALMELWSKLLDGRMATVVDDFFALGGDSFRAVLMLTRITERFGVELAPAAVLRNPTIEALAAAIDAERTEHRESNTTPERNSIVPLSGGSSIPLYLVHPSGGGVLCYRALGAECSEHRLFAFRSEGLRLHGTVDASIDEMAARYVQALNEHSDGPILLGGWSLGGVVAHAIAERLDATGRVKGPLVLIDSPAPRPQPLPDESEIWRWFVQDALGALPTSVDTSAQAQLPQNLGDLVVLFRETLGLHTSGEELDRIFRTFRANVEALSVYEPPKFQIPVMQLKAQSTGTDQLSGHVAKTEPDWGWSSIVGDRVEAIPVEGNHYTILTPPNVARLAALIRNRLTALGLW